MAKLKQKKPKRRVWRKVLIVALGLVVFLLMFVSAFIFNPFEGSLTELRDVVPRDVNFFVRKRLLAYDFAEFPEPKFWQELSEARGFDEFTNGPMTADGRQVTQDAVQAARDVLEQLAEGSGGQLDLLNDIVGNELIIAGYNQDYSVAPPRPLAEPWYCVYTRVSWRVKAALGVLGFGFAQGMAQDGGLNITSEDGLLVVTPPGASKVYIKRHLDVVMVANHKSLLESAELLINGNRDIDPIGQQPAYTEGADKRIKQWAEAHDVEDPNVVEFVVEPNAFDGFRRFAKGWPDIRNRDSMNERVLASFLNLSGWLQVTGGLMFDDDVLAATGQIGLNSKQHTSFQSSFYTAEQQRRQTWLDPFLDLVPQSACAAAALRVPAGDFLLAMFDALDEAEKTELNDALRRTSFQGEQVNDFGDLVSRLRTAFLMRTGFIFRRNEPDLSLDPDGSGKLAVPVAAKSPMPQVAWVFWLRPSGSVLVEEFVQMMRTYYPTFGFKKSWDLRVPFNGRNLGEPVTEFTNPQIPATGEIATIVFREFFIVSNSGPLIRDIVRTRYSAQTNLPSIRALPEFEQIERELPATPSGLIWLSGPNMVKVFDDYLAFADTSSSIMDAEWAMENREAAEDHVRRTKYPQYPSKAAMPRNLTQQGGDFDRAVGAYLQQRWAQARTNFTADDRAQMQQLRGLCQMLRAISINLELQNNYIRFQARGMLDLK